MSFFYFGMIAHMFCTAGLVGRHQWPTMKLELSRPRNPDGSSLQINSQPKSDNHVLKRQKGFSNIKSQEKILPRRYPMMGMRMIGKRPTT